MWLARVRMIRAVYGAGRSIHPWAARHPAPRLGDLVGAGGRVHGDFRLPDRLLGAGRPAVP